MSRRNNVVDKKYTAGKFRGPARKDTDWEHIFERHWHGGRIAQHRATGDIFGSLSKADIKKVVDQAWEQRKRYRTQGERILYRADINTREWNGTVEMWFNTNTKMLETAYPVGAGR